MRADPHSDFTRSTVRSVSFQVSPPQWTAPDVLELRYAGTFGDVEVAFTETFDFPPATVVFDPSSLVRITEALSLVAGLSYYKALVPTDVRIEMPVAPAAESLFAAAVAEGLGEFAYRNDLVRALTPGIDVALRPDDVRHRSEAPAAPTRPLVAVGGGKDSIVAIDLLRRLGTDQTLFSVNTYDPIVATAERAGLPILSVRRRLDPTLFDLNERGAPNGHVPVTAVNSLVAALVALRNGHDAVVFSNEASASAGNLEWQGHAVNHQWSKGLAAERLLADVIEPTGVSYLSVLRPLSELAIMRRFARLIDFHDVFVSCNRSFHLDASRRSRWCGDCPKCRFVYLCLAPFLGPEPLAGIFGGRDLLADPDQREGVLALFNADGRLKPFECVGEPSECRAALTLLDRDPAWSGHPFLADPDVRACLVTDEVVVSALGDLADHRLPDAWLPLVAELAEVSRAIR